MTSSALLSVELLNVLLPFTEPFAATSVRFRKSLAGSNDETFQRVCELHNTLNALTDSKRPMSHLWNLRRATAPAASEGAAEDAGRMRQDAEDLLSVMLNSEYVLYELYHEYTVSMNPSLAHWVGICREFDRYTREHAEGNAEWGLRERVLKIRAAFVKGILDNHGPHLANITPQHFAFHGHDYHVNLDAFRGALLSQGIYDAQDADRELEPGGSSPMSPAASDNFPDSASGPYSQTRSEKTSTPATPSNHQEAPAQIVSLILRAAGEELPSSLVNRLLASLSAAPELIPSYPLEILSASTLANLFAANQGLARGLLLVFLAHGSKLQRSQLIASLEFLPVCLDSLEMLNELISKTTLLNVDETLHLVHGLLSNGMRTAQELNGAVNRSAQARLVKLLCLFLQSVLRNDVVCLQDVFYLIQDLGVRFMSVKEARDLWRAYCASA